MTVKRKKSQEKGLTKQQTLNNVDSTLSISPEQRILDKSNKKLDRSVMEHILDRLEADKNLTMTSIAKEYSVSRQRLSQLLQPVREARLALRDKLFGEKLKNMMTYRLETHDQLDTILQELLNKAQTTIKGECTVEQHVILAREVKDLVYRIGSNWIAFANTMKPLGVTVSSGDRTPNNSSPVNILNIFIKKDGKSVEDAGDAQGVALEELRKLNEHVEDMKNLGKFEEAEFEEVG